MEARLAVQLAGEPVLLLADRALFWPALGMLLIADLHLGKGDVFRRHGISVPSGGTAEDLERLTTLLVETGARELCVLGDFLHGPVDAARWQATWLAWRARHADVRMRVVVGNHDRQLDRVADALGVELVDEGLLLPPFQLRHVPGQGPAHVLAGHMHPRLRVPGLRGRWPVFWLQPGLTILPAFSRFTGGMDPRPDPRDRLVVCLGDLLVAMPGGGRA